MLAGRVDFHRFSTPSSASTCSLCSIIHSSACCVLEMRYRSVSLPGWQLEVLVPPAGVQKINVCFTCPSLCSYELDTVLRVTQCPWFGLNPRESLENAAQNWGVF